MPRKVVRKERGVFEKVPGSDIWWIRFKVAGVEHREKVGRRGEALPPTTVAKALGKASLRQTMHALTRDRFKALADQLGVPIEV